MKLNLIGEYEFVKEYEATHQIYCTTPHQTYNAYSARIEPYYAVNF